ncbi:MULTISPECIES: YbgC/FadM family acyl-CoA thioesterase [unclassified Novosphingobium]|uniref:YbgC/FadM family acyl-CoA thioesterase n=1 Tax=unclassified Novosphingobium TaxID=2644732 RepID=UPI001359F22B|nr:MULTISPECIES: YbgC/FadM family acyl-CoA thioesterase [unclassified Novosphingobium]
MTDNPPSSGTTSRDPSPQTGVIDGDIHRYALRVFYEDTDAGGVVYHANYLAWFERARSDLLDMLGVDQSGAIEAGLGLYAVAEANLRYLAPARLGDAVVIDTWAESIGRVSATLRQVARRGAVRLCEATVKVGFISLEGRPRRQPEAWQQAFASLVPISADDAPDLGAVVTSLKSGIAGTALQSGIAGREGQE